MKDEDHDWSRYGFEDDENDLPGVDEALALAVRIAAGCCVAVIVIGLMVLAVL